MAKVVRKWIQTDWTKDGVLRSVDIPYSGTASITARLDRIKDSTDQSIQIEELSSTPSTEASMGKLYTKEGEMFFLDESGNEIRLSRDGKMASVTRTKVENHTEYFVLDANDITNGYVTLEAVPDPYVATEMSQIGGANFEYGVDFAVVQPTGETDRIQLTWDSTASAEVTTGLIGTVAATDVIKVNYFCPEEVQDHAVDKKVEYVTLDGTDISNKYVTLAAEAWPPESTELILLGNTHLQYTEDFVVKADANGDYKTLSWAATDTDTGLEGTLVSTDRIKIVYTQRDVTQFRNTEKKVIYHTLTGTDISNKYIDLTNTPVPIDATELTMLGGTEFRYTEDFIIKRDGNGEYRRLSWAAADTNIGLEGTLASSDLLKVAYMDGVGLLGAIRISEDDTQPSFLSDKLISGSNVTLTVSNSGQNETITISTPDSTNIDKEVEYLTLDGTDISNKYKDLVNTPVNGDEAEVSVIGGMEQHYGTDFNLITDGSTIKRVSWSGYPLDGQLAASDVLKVSYLREL